VQRQSAIRGVDLGQYYSQEKELRLAKCCVVRVAPFGEQKQDPAPLAISPSSQLANFKDDPCRAAFKRGQMLASKGEQRISSWEMEEEGRFCFVVGGV